MRGQESDLPFPVLGSLFLELGIDAKTRNASLKARLIAIDLIRSFGTFIEWARPI